MTSPESREPWLGYSPFTGSPPAGGGREALTITAERKFDAIVCDLMMPDVSGIHVAEALSRQQPTAARSPHLDDRRSFHARGTRIPEGRGTTH